MARPRWEFPLTLDRHDDRPLFLQIASAIADDICRGRLKPGDALPGSRQLAKSLGVNRVTVLTAISELAAQGWIVVERSKGVRVSSEIPGASDRVVRRGREAAMPAAIYSVPAAPAVQMWPEPQRGVLLLNSWPDTRLIQTEPLARAFRAVLARHGRRALAYGDPSGHPALRAAVAQMLAAARGLAVGAEDVMITRGSQMALSLIARAILGPGKSVAIEAVGYPHAWQSFRLAGTQVVPIPVDREGLDVDALERKLQSRRIDAVYVTPHHQFPTTVTLTAARRARLLDLARQHRMLIIEDDYDDAFHYEGRPVMPLASIDRAGVVVYLGTFSKVYAPGLRLGYVVAPAAVRAPLVAHRHFLDIHGDLAIEAAVARLIEQGEVQRHIRRVKRIYRARRDLFAELLAGQARERLAFDTPAGGVALWVHTAPGVDVETWAARARQKGARFLTARTFAFDGRPRPYARLGFAALNEHEIAAAVDRLAAALPSR